MKYLLLTCLLLATATSASPGPAQGWPAPTGTTKVMVYFSHKNTFVQLAAVRQELLKDEIILEYDRLAFDPSGHLAKLSFHVEYRGEIWGRATNDSLTDDSLFGFYRDFTPGAANPFRIGNLK